MEPGLTLIIFVLCVGGSLLLVALIQSRMRRFFTDRRLGLLGTGQAPSADARRAARLGALGSVGTTHVYNCGKILHVDYDRGELIVEREPLRRARRFVERKGIR